MDLHSYARPDEARVTSLALDLRADFDARRLIGRVTLTIDRAPGSRAVVLDTRGLRIHAVTDLMERPLPHSIGPHDAILGSALEVTLPEDISQVIVNYETTPDAAALQWLTPEQTAGRQHPFLFSQGQAILTRTWIPTQDSPGIRQTYVARIVVPRTLEP